MTNHVLRRNDAGSAMSALLISVVLCGTLSAAIVTTNVSRQREADKALAREKAFHLAEAGIDWGVAQLRRRSGNCPDNAETRTAAGAGSFSVRYTQGDHDHVDNDGDGRIDDPGERDYAVLISTGESGKLRRSIEVTMRKAVQVPSFDAAVQINVEAPVLDLRGNAFTIDGNDHYVDDTTNNSTAPKWGIASPAFVAYVKAQVPVKNYDQITGEGPVPSIGKVAPIDLDLLMEQARQSAGTIIAPGTHDDLTLGDASSHTLTTSYCNGDLHLSGNVGGCGVLAVDGDLRISGSFLWTGIVIVRGRVTFVGGGAVKRIIGTMAVGEEVDGHSESTEVEITGTVDLDYSSEAIQLAADALSVMSVMSWREVGNP